MISIIPSILSNNPTEVKDLLEKINGHSRRVSVDVLDGVFVDNKTVSPDIFSSFEYEFLYEFQLMVEEPVNWIEKCVRGGAEMIVGHVERMQSQVEFVGGVQGVGKKVGLALDLGTAIESIDKTVIKDLDMILLMSVSAGFGGQKFDGAVFEKISKLNEIRERDNTPFKIQIDGGVKVSNIKKIAEYGVDEVSVGRGLFEGSVGDNIDKYQKAAYG